MDIRYPIYADANIIVDSGQEGIEVTVDKVVIGLSVPRQDFKSKTSQ
jgi:hypothetical protein